MAKHGQWRNRYKRAMSDPAFKAKVLGMQREKLAEAQTSATLAVVSLSERLEALDAEIAELSGAPQGEAQAE